MSGHNGPWSDTADTDVAAAGRLSRRLTGEVRRGQCEEEVNGGEEHPYLQFRSRSPAATPNPELLSEVAEDTDAAILPPAPDDIDSWDRFLSWCRQVSGAPAAFVVDPQGFIIATSGGVPGKGYAGVGAELGYATEQLDRIDTDAGALCSVDVEYERRHLSVLRVATNETQPLLLTLVSAVPLSAEVKRTILSQAEHSLPRLG